VRSDITGQTGDGGLFYEWELDVPLVNLKGTSKVEFRAPPVAGAGRTVHVEVVRGDVHEGTWDWQFLPAAGGPTLLGYHGYADVTKSSWVLRKLIAHNPTLEHGAVLASGIVFVKAVKLRAETLAGHADGKRPRIDQSLERQVVLRSLRGTIDPATLAP